MTRAPTRSVPDARAGHRGSPAAGRCRVRREQAPRPNHMAPRRRPGRSPGAPDGAAPRFDAIRPGRVRHPSRQGGGRDTRVSRSRGGCSTGNPWRSRCILQVIARSRRLLDSKSVFIVPAPGYKMTVVQHRLTGQCGPGHPGRPGLPPARSGSHRHLLYGNHNRGQGAGFGHCVHLVSGV